MISGMSRRTAARFRGTRGFLLALVTLWALMPAVAPVPACAAESAFHGFLKSLWPRAAARGVSRATFTRTIADITEDPSVPVAVGKQPEFERLLSAYFKEAVSPTRIARGRALAAAYRSELDTAARRYGVPSGILLAAWGMESDFGRDRGNKDVVRSLATLAFHRRDSDLFVNEFAERARHSGAGAPAAQPPHRLLGGRDGRPAIHALGLSQICRELSRRGRAGHLEQSRRYAGVDWPFSARLRLEPSIALGRRSSPAGEFRLRNSTCRFSPTSLRRA